MEFYEKLQALRKQKGLTQEELAKALYVTRTAVSKWESGRGYPNIDSLKTIAAYFSVTVDDLLSCDEVLNIADDEKKQHRSRLYDRVFALLNLSVVVLLCFLPCFRQTAEDSVMEVSLLYLTAVASYMRAAYMAAVSLILGIGVALIALRRCSVVFWQRSKYLLSVATLGLGLWLCILGSQPYAATLLLVVLTIQGVLLLEK